MLIPARRLDVQPELLILAVQPHSRRFARSRSLEAPDPAGGPAAWASEVRPDPANARNQDVAKWLGVLSARNNRFFDEETGKLEQWAEDVKLSLEQEIKALDGEIREARKVSLAAGALSDKLNAQRQLKALESRRKEKRQRLFDAQDEEDEQRASLIGKIEAQLRQTHQVQVLYRVRWKLAKELTVKLGLTVTFATSKVGREVFDAGDAAYKGYTKDGLFCLP